MPEEIIRAIREIRIQALVCDRGVVHKRVFSRTWRRVLWKASGGITDHANDRELSLSLAKDDVSALQQYSSRIEVALHFEQPLVVAAVLEVVKDDLVKTGSDVVAVAVVLPWVMAREAELAQDERGLAPRRPLL